MSGRRAGLRFDSLDAMRAEVVRLMTLESAGRLRSEGNWTLGQAVGHIATWMSFAFNGTPLKLPALWLRLVGKLFKQTILQKGLRPGFNFRGVRNGTLGTELLASDVALAKLDAQIARFASETPTAPNPIMGKLTPEEWRSLQLRHAELHLSFFQETAE